jgi:hypothetical protein
MALKMGRGAYVAVEPSKGARKCRAHDGYKERTKNRTEQWASEWDDRCRVRREHSRFVALSFRRFLVLAFRNVFKGEGSPTR